MKMICAVCSSWGKGDFEYIGSTKMIEIQGVVKAGAGNAGPNFQQGTVELEAAKLLGVSAIVHGTLNVEISEEYSNLDDDKYDIEIPAKKYNGREFVKLKRCKINGYRSIIIRPADHFVVQKFRKRIEIMSDVVLRDLFSLDDEVEVAVQLQGDDAWWYGKDLQKGTNDETIP